MKEEAGGYYPLGNLRQGGGVGWSGVEGSGVEWSGVEWSGVEWSQSELKPFWRCRSLRLVLPAYDFFDRAIAR
jgi:hypothetical protein